MKQNKDNIDVMTAFFQQLELFGKKDKNVFFITADHGAWALSSFKKKLKKQCMNIGISEQNMISFAAGMALNKKKVFLFTITPFITQRCMEQIKVDLCFPNLPVTIVGNGSSLTYSFHGTSHQSIEDVAMMRSLPNLTILNPCDNQSSREAVNIAYKSKGPVYIKLDKGFFPDVYSKKSDIRDGVVEFNSNIESHLSIITTGNMIESAKKLSENLLKKNIKSSIIDIFKIKPLNKKKLIGLIKSKKFLISIEEQHIDGGIGSQLCEIIADENLNIPIKRFGIKDKYSKLYGNRDWLRSYYEIDVSNIFSETLKWIKSQRLIEIG